MKNRLEEWRKKYQIKNREKILEKRKIYNTENRVKLSEKATKRSAEINKARYPKMGTYKGKDGKSVADEKRKVNKKKSGPKTPSGFVRDKGRLYAARRAQGKKLMNKLKAKKRAQEMYKKNKANK